MSDERVAAQVVQQAAASERILAFLTSVLLSDSLPLVTDLLSLLTHVARVSPEHLPFLQSILGGSDTSHQPLTRLLGHREPPVRAKTCSLLGNLLQHRHGLPQALQSQLESSLASLLACLADRDQAVRRAASFAVGNAAYNPCTPPRSLRGAVPGLTRLLLDPNSRTRRNAASALGNLWRRSAELGELLLEIQAPRVLLEVACRDPQAGVREGALLALRAASRHPGVQQVSLALLWGRWWRWGDATGLTGLTGDSCASVCPAGAAGAGGWREAGGTCGQPLSLCAPLPEARPAPRGLAQRLRTRWHPGDHLWHPDSRDSRDTASSSPTPSGSPPAPWAPCPAPCLSPAL